MNNNIITDLIARKERITVYRSQDIYHPKLDIKIDGCYCTENKRAAMGLHQIGILFVFDFVLTNKTLFIECRSRNRNHLRIGPQFVYPRSFWDSHHHQIKQFQDADDLSVKCINELAKKDGFQIVIYLHCFENPNHPAGDIINSIYILDDTVINNVITLGRYKYEEKGFYQKKI